MQQAAKLKFVDQLGLERLAKIERSVFSIGRKPDNDLQLLFDTISRKHAEITSEGDGYYILDKGSSSGTLVNSQQITRAKLAGGDIIFIGGKDGCRLEFIIESTDAVQAGITANAGSTTSV